MKQYIKYGAFYIELEEGEKAINKSVQLGNTTLNVGDVINCLGDPKNARSNFSLVDGYLLRFQGWVGPYIIFDATKPDGNIEQLNLFPMKKRRLYYAFAYISKNSLLVHSSANTAYDINLM